MDFPVMCKHSLCAVVFLLCGVSSALEVSGTVINIDSSPRSGVVVRLSSGVDSAITDASGNWALEMRPSSVSRRSILSLGSGPLQVRGSRLELRFGGADLSGRRGTSVQEYKILPRLVAGRTLDAVDSIVYSWKGRRFLRDTVSASRSGLVRVFDTTWNAEIVYGYLTDDRDGQIYRTVLIGSQTWMAQNLNFMGSGMDSGWAYKNSPDSARKFGRLYNWASALGMVDSCNQMICSTRIAKPQRGICPSGWHVPTEFDWNMLSDTTLERKRAGTTLRSSGGWFEVIGKDSVGFRALASSAYFRGESFGYASSYAYWWIASEKDSAKGWSRMIEYNEPYVFRLSTTKSNGQALRCIED